MVSESLLLLDYWDLKLFDMYYIWIVLIKWTLILFWGETISINKIVKSVNFCVIVVKFFFLQMNKRHLHLIYMFVHNFLFVSRVLTYYSIWVKGYTYPALVLLNTIYFVSKKFFVLFYTYKIYENSLRRIQSHMDLYFI